MNNFLGLFLSVLGILFEFLSSYFLTINKGEDNIRFIYHYNDFPNFFQSLFNGICYIIIIYIFDLYCKSIDIIFNTFFYIGLLSSLICFSLSFLYSELTKIRNSFSEFGNLQDNYYILSVIIYLFNIILQSILIKKCSVYSVGIVISSQISIRNIVHMIKYEDNSDSNFFTLLSLILCFFWIIYY